MYRIITVILLLFFVAAPQAQAGYLDPPLTGDMARLKTFSVPPKIPEAILSKAGTGLTYLSEYKGKIILLNVWATWCPPCIAELPSLNALQIALKSEDFEVITVSTDQMELTQIQEYLMNRGWRAIPPYADANGDIQSLEVFKGIAGLPVTLILDRNMNALAMFEGDADWNGPAARAVINYYIHNAP
jgi:thiol-disulfide isomerase/thioredoxin